MTGSGERLLKCLTVITRPSEDAKRIDYFISDSKMECIEYFCNSMYVTYQKTLLGKR